MNSKLLVSLMLGALPLTMVAQEVGNGLIEGDGGRLSPGANATREQVAMIMMRFSQLMK
ncbi:MAG: hypothetical protein IJM11_00280 [Firmicutes bacterium]|nr:hypothetical protein [Bacillota bacterium]